MSELELGMLLPLRVLILEPLGNLLSSLGAGNGCWVDPELELSVQFGLVHIWWVCSNVKSENETDTNCFHPFLESPDRPYENTSIVIGMKITTFRFFYLIWKPN